MIPLVSVEGPTASGKTGLAIRLAEALGAEIISADSRQIYTQMDIGTAKPTPQELAAVPHHLIGIIDPGESYNVGRFRSDALEALSGLRRRGRLPLVCGGTGLYVRGLLEGLFPLPQIPSEIRESLKARLAAEGLETLYQELKQVDPDFAAMLSPNDTQRVLRGLEVHLASGRPISEHWREQRRDPQFRAFRVLLDPPREVLYARINRRMEQMLERGLLQEIQTLLDSGYTAASPGLSSLGYREFLPHLAGSASLEECAALAAQHTRNYAKRQCTWYRNCKFDLTIAGEDVIISDVAGRISAWLD